MARPPDDALGQQVGQGSVDCGGADADDPIWRLPSFDTKLDLRSALSYARPGGGLPHEMARARVDVPLRVSDRGALEKAGPLGPVWRTTDSWEPTHAFHPRAGAATCLTTECRLRHDRE